ncbi:uncharacterized protein CNMa [Fopius arisanus]|uniref:SucC_0 protein n=1 Tax=Fopius arisanus TaxID=64838 RepID=A0A0C9RAM3_9HYME|nr:PREDICTED: uncharacterized protein LOC105270364 [Fopius arisanus]XP_011309547.1 PREDICTED: uncharacterized protein LOC105270364 [Fopius arisanus]XP_011309549.1 PREDICTED: uncharacterized protein LOC105270364 [Fopius arisanus]
MKQRIMRKKCTSLRLLILAVFSLTTIHNVWGAHQPLSAMYYADSLVEDSENLLLLQRLKQIAALEHKILEEERELTEAEFDLRAIFEEKMRNRRPIGSESFDEEPEKLPIPSAVVHAPSGHTGKRTSYMGLCHFKICNMGRKRQL